MSSPPVRLSVIIPVYNEERTVDQLVDAVRHCGIAELEVVIVNDGSDDGTQAQLEPFADIPGIQVVHHDTNRGKGAAIQTAQPLVRGRAVVIQDGDLEYSPNEFPHMLSLIEAGHADAVFGSRYSGRELQVDTFWHYNANRLLTTVSNVLCNIHLTDMETCYKMVRADLFQRLRLTSNHFGIEPEITARLAQLHARIWEVPIAYRARRTDQGKKIGWRDGCAALWYIAKYNLLDRQRPQVPTRGIDPEP